MSGDLFTAIALALTLAALIGFGVRRLVHPAWRKLPETLGRERAVADFQLPGFRGLSPTDFASSNDQGAFGEALTYVLMGQDGWHPINGKPGPGPQGLDGIFIKLEGLGWRARFIETKTNSGRYLAPSMSDAKLLGDLDTLYLTTADRDLQTVYAALSDAVRTGARHIRKELWRHNLSTGRCEITTLGEDGRRLGHPAVRRVETAMNALRAGVAELDHRRVILRSQPG